MPIMTETLAVVRPEAPGYETLITTLNHIALLKDIRKTWLRNRDFSAQETQDFADLNFEIKRFEIILSNI